MSFCNITVSSPWRTSAGAVTGRWSGVGRLVLEYQCHIRALAGRSEVLGVYLDLMISPGDCPALTPASLALIHRIQTTFTQPLYPGFGINFGSSLKLSSAEIL